MVVMRKNPMNNDHLFSLRYFDNCLMLSQKSYFNISDSSVSVELILAYFKELLFPKKNFVLIYQNGGKSIQLAVIIDVHKVYSLL